MTDSEKYWFEHLRRIDRTGSTTKAYADLHGLSAKELYEWRRKFRTRDQGQADQSCAVSQPAGQSTASKLTTSNPFVPVQVRPPMAAAQRASCVVQCGAIRVELDALPSVQWIASLHQAIGRAG